MHGFNQFLTNVIKPVLVLHALHLKKTQTNVSSSLNLSRVDQILRVKNGIKLNDFIIFVYSISNNTSTLANP
jgi:hypothetical protein